MFRPTLVRSTFLVSVLTVCSLSASYAQQRFSAGPRVGLNMSTFGRDAQGYMLRPGVTAGAFLMYSSLNHFGISGDVLYSQMGGKFSQNNESYKQRINYLEIPVALRYFLTLSGNFRPNLFFGPSLGIKLNAKRTDNVKQSVASPDFNNSAQFNDLDLGLIAGFQLNFKGLAERQHFLIDARYRYGLSDITIDPNQNINNSTITLTLGYSFGVGPEYRSRR
ncbi:porin family protein [Spirosoma luteum]|uniref:porin family protein n=1 Tax=Spirosoma luteum TaxID=431553 RepID=UPI000476EB62|nr:porin family protein [Spirosoma luteum]